MWRIIGGIDTTFTTHPEGCTAFCLEFVDGSILLERVPEESFGDLGQTFSDLTLDMPNQSSELDTQLMLESISLELICSSFQE